MQSFSIGDIELLTGIKAHSWRSWEKRYSFFKASRKESQRRIYSNKDLRKLLCISFLYHNGWKIANIAALADDAMAAAVRKTELNEGNYKTYVQKLLDAACDFNEAAFSNVLNGLIDKIGFERTITEICYSYLQKVALLRDVDSFIAAQEHFPGHIIQSRVISETEKFSFLQNEAPEMILFGPGNEHNELPLLYLNYLLRKHGWKVLYLGTNSKLVDLKAAAEVSGIKSLYLHISTNLPGFTIDDYLETLRKTFPAKMIIASGKGIEQSQRSFMQVQLLKRDEDIHRFIASRA